MKERVTILVVWQRLIWRAHKTAKWPKSVVRAVDWDESLTSVDSADGGGAEQQRAGHF